MDLFRIKPLEKILGEAEESGEGTLNKTLGVTALTLLGVGAIIGTGIFVLTGQAAGKYAGRSTSSADTSTSTRFIIW